MAFNTIILAISNGKCEVFRSPILKTQACEFDLPSVKNAKNTSQPNENESNAFHKALENTGMPSNMWTASARPTLEIIISITAKFSSFLAASLIRNYTQMAGLVFQTMSDNTTGHDRLPSEYHISIKCIKSCNP